eukprot:gb/GFBE01029981.1/.p1 GENE.gb/GFBE01029981.1/~~gb/GFBE01029981.1/.p1  ORF type:complete len:179 (+),score=24.30 gb/GFBE01029981.1/:1-537(+)
MATMVQAEVLQNHPMGSPPSRELPLVQATLIAVDLHSHTGLVQPPGPGQVMGQSMAPPRPRVVVGETIGAPMLGFQDLGSMSVVRGRLDEDSEDAPAEETLCLALVACLCCCWLTGLVAIFKSKEVSIANNQGDYKTAHEKRKQAVKFIYLTILSGMVTQTAYALYTSSTRAGSWTGL